ncbi:hypothetical protein WR25_17823 [Diploscapter pachys]|uniref:BACK domain-containing protein n=1 Tax=Diploscapter pachys TaxID=2018661 RepID=A0A2A2KNM7_9BILA|nr:hypothetical protein WR25_17823 [Diploscapter pachys]
MQTPTVLNGNVNLMPVSNAQFCLIGQRVTCSYVSPPPGDASVVLTITVFNSFTDSDLRVQCVQNNANICTAEPADQAEKLSKLPGLAPINQPGDSDQLESELNQELTTTLAPNTEFLAFQHDTKIRRKRNNCRSCTLRGTNFFNDDIDHDKKGTAVAVMAYNPETRCNEAQIVCIGSENAMTRIGTLRAYSSFKELLENNRLCDIIILSEDKHIPAHKKHFIAVSQSEEFVQLDINEVTQILEKDELYIDSEKDVLEAAIRWIRFDEANRKDYSARLLSCVRLPLLKPSFISDEVASHPLFKPNLACRDLVDEAKDYHLMPDRRASFKSFRTKPRECPDIPGLIFAVGGFAKSPEAEALSSVEMYDPLTRKWSSVEKMPTTRSRVGVAVCQKELYAIGGYNGLERLKTVEVFDYSNKSWRMYLVAMMDQVFSTVLKDSVCYDGSQFLKSCEVFDFETMKWSLISPMNESRSRVALAANFDALYAIAGYDGTNNLSTVEMYKEKSDSWNFAPSLSDHEGGIAVAVLPIPPQLLSSTEYSNLGYCRK